MLGENDIGDGKEDRNPFRLNHNERKNVPILGCCLVSRLTLPTVYAIIFTNSREIKTKTIIKE